MRAIAIAAPLVVAVSFAVLGPPIARRIPPRHATWLLSAGAVVIALCGLAVLSLLGFVLIGEVPNVANEGHWSVSTIREHAPAEPGLSAAALLALAAAAAGTLVVGARRGMAVLAAYRSCKDLPTAAGDLVVVDEARASAVAIPGRPGRIVVARALLTELSVTERRALLAHERAHLEHGHHWHLTAVAVAAAANPFLARLRGAVSHAAERWADEEAAAAVGDRRAVASAVVHAARLWRGSPQGAGAAMAAGSSAVPDRVAALLARPLERRPGLMILALSLLVAGIAGAVVAGKETEHLFEFAGRAYRAAHGS